VNEAASVNYSISEHDRKLIERYAVSLVSASAIKPSPENEEIYGPINEQTDPAIFMLIRSIERIGLEEPLILTRDHFILSGHRRFYALSRLRWERIPVRFANVTRASESDYHRLLAQYNPQRVKSVAGTLAETLLNSSGEDDDYSDSWASQRAAKAQIRGERLVVGGYKAADPIGPRQLEFLRAVQKVIESLRNFWPLTIRTIHYKLLNDPPLTQVTKKRKERWRYKNNLACYNKLSNLLVSARYADDVSFSAIDDSTRESIEGQRGFQDISQFLRQQVSRFLTGYHRDRREGQVHHVEVVVEKMTLLGIVDDICRHFYLPLTPLKGYGGPSLWRRIEERYRESGKEKCIVIILSDHDPEGLNLVDDCVRSLRDLHGVPVEAIRPLLTMEQVQRYNLHPNWAKEKSSRFTEYVNRTGTRQSWECEALEPDIVRQCLHDAIMSVTNAEQLNAVQEREAEEKSQLRTIKRRLGNRLQEMLDKGEEW
jgi:hypothetical protein